MVTVMVTVPVLVALVLFGAVAGALLMSVATTFDRPPRYLRTPPRPEPPSGGRHRAEP